VQYEGQSAHTGYVPLAEPRQCLDTTNLQEGEIISYVEVLKKIRCVRLASGMIQVNSY